MKDDFLYIVEQGEDHEGVSRSSLHRTLEGARTKATSWIAEEESWRTDERIRWREEEPVNCLYQWQGGCDWMHIREKNIYE